MIKISVGETKKGFSGYNSEFQFAFCSAPIKGKRSQVTKLHSCRDYLHDAIRSHIHKQAYGNTGHGYHYGCGASLDMKRLRLIITGSMRGDLAKAFKDGLYSGKRVINYYEKKAGWTPTRVFEVNYPGKKKGWLLIGPEGWMRNPHLLSLYSLVLRVFIRIGKDVKLKTEKDIIKFYTTKAMSLSSATDRELLKNTWNKGLLVIQHRETLFKGMTLAKLFPKDLSWTSFHNQGGFHALCTSATYSVKLNKRITELCNNKKVAIRHASYY